MSKKYSKANPSKITSPCVNLCSLDKDDVCIGCYRTGKEISAWGRMSSHQQRDVLIKVREREQASPLVD
ncbi:MULTISPECIES: DUF1289 domain-containing protein [Marinomonas]|uniref:DUF1289 domain-containing protein n=1 Tax=Marinomonas TaxID=28253 RepID=UPI001056D7A6|nr:DUF1289 domain-containing protein [Marinomonas flavescens]